MTGVTVVADVAGRLIVVVGMAGCLTVVVDVVVGNLTVLEAGRIPE